MWEFRPIGQNLNGSSMKNLHAEQGPSIDGVGCLGGDLEVKHVRLILHPHLELQATCTEQNAERALADLAGVGDVSSTPLCPAV